MLKLIIFSWKRPTLLQIKKEIIKAREYSYLVATKDLDKEHGLESLPPGYQKQLNPSNNKYSIAVFH